MYHLDRAVRLRLALILLGGLLWVLVSVSTTMANGEDLQITVSVPSEGLKVGSSSKTDAIVTVSVTNISDHRVKFFGPDFTIVREGVSKAGMTTGNSFVGRRTGDGLAPVTEREPYVNLKSGESKSFEFDLSQLFVMDQLWSIILYKPILKAVSIGRYDFAARVLVGNGKNAKYLSSQIFKVEVER